MTGTMLKVDGKRVKDPSTMTWGLKDVTSGDTGYTEDGIYHKTAIATKRKLSLGWNFPTPEETAAILQAFNPVYVDVTYYDAMSGQEETRTFWSDGKNAPVKMWTAGKKLYTSITINLEEQ
ncbi:MAG: hypothetical protein SOW08_01680 [Lachnospiraceae bacterium]|nr:hypothetical protein [Lachnospiraceae bacterium]